MQRGAAAVGGGVGLPTISLLHRSQVPTERPRSSLQAHVVPQEAGSRLRVRLHLRAQLQSDRVESRVRATLPPTRH